MKGMVRVGDRLQDQRVRCSLEREDTAGIGIAKEKALGLQGNKCFSSYGCPVASSGRR